MNSVSFLPWPAALIKETTQELMCDKEQMTKVQVMTMSRFYTTAPVAFHSHMCVGEECKLCRPVGPNAERTRPMELWSFRTKSKNFDIVDLLTICL